MIELRTTSDYLASPYRAMKVDNILFIVSITNKLSASPVPNNISNIIQNYKNQLVTGIGPNVPGMTKPIRVEVSGADGSRVLIYGDTWQEIELSTTSIYYKGRTDNRNSNPKPAADAIISNNGFIYIKASTGLSAPPCMYLDFKETSDIQGVVSINLPNCTARSTIDHLVENIFTSRFRIENKGLYMSIVDKFIEFQNDIIE